jgi:hypothetical protein
MTLVAEAALGAAASSSQLGVRRRERGLLLALVACYVLFAWPCPPTDPLAGRTLGLAEAFSNGRLRVQGPEARLSGDFLYPDGVEGGGVAFFEFGASAAFAPAAWAVHAAVPAGIERRRDRVLFLESVLFILLLSALPAAWAAVLVRRTAARLRVPHPDVCALAFGLTVLLPLACMVNVHPSSTSLAALSLLLLVERDRGPRRSLLAGLAAGASVLCYFGALVAFAVPAGIYALLVGSRRDRLAFVVGAGAAACVLFAWNTVNFGAPWATPDQASALGGVRDEASHGVLFTLTAPSARLLFEVLFGARRGVLVFAPVLALGIAGLKPLWRRRRDVALLLIGVAAGAALQAAGKPVSWHGGTAAGPRYLLLAALALSVPLGYGWARFPRLGIALGWASLLAAASTAQSPLYGSLRACVEDVIAFGPRLRWVHSFGHQLDAGDVTRLAFLLSPLIALPVLGGVTYLLRPAFPRAGRAWVVLALTWGLLALPHALLGTRGETRKTVRLAEVRRFVRVEENAVRLRWYAGTLRKMGAPLEAGEAYLEAIQRGGWEREERARFELADVIRDLQAQGRGEEALRLLARAEALKRASGAR